MAWEIISIIAEAFWLLFGGQSMMIPLFIIGTLALIMMIIRVPAKAVILVLVPLVTTLIGYGASKYFMFPSSSYGVVIGIWMALGLIVAFMFMRLVE